MTSKPKKATMKKATALAMESAEDCERLGETVLTILTDLLKQTETAVDSSDFETLESIKGESAQAFVLAKSADDLILDTANHFEQAEGLAERSQSTMAKVAETYTLISELIEATA